MSMKYFDNDDVYYTSPHGRDTNKNFDKSFNKNEVLCKCNQGFKFIKKDLEQLVSDYFVNFKTEPLEIIIRENPRIISSDIYQLILDKYYSTHNTSCMGNRYIELYKKLLLNEIYPKFEDFVKLNEEFYIRKNLLETYPSTNLHITPTFEQYFRNARQILKDEIYVKFWIFPNTRWETTIQTMSEHPEFFGDLLLE